MRVSPSPGDNEKPGDNAPFTCFFIVKALGVPLVACTGVPLMAKFYTFRSTTSGYKFCTNSYEEPKNFSVFRVFRGLNVLYSTMVKPAADNFRNMDEVFSNSNYKKFGRN
jgi:hypothetical protein